MSEIEVARNPLIVAASDERHLASIGWAITHQPTRDAYQRCTGEDVGPVLDRYRAWLEENIIGAGEDIA